MFTNCCILSLNLTRSGESTSYHFSFFHLSVLLYFFFSSFHLDVFFLFIFPSCCLFPPPVGRPCSGGSARSGLRSGISVQLSAVLRQWTFQWLCRRGELRGILRKLRNIGWNSSSCNTLSACERFASVTSAEGEIKRIMSWIWGGISWIWGEICRETDREKKWKKIRGKGIQEHCDSYLD